MSDIQPLIDAVPESALAIVANLVEIDARFTPALKMAVRLRLSRRGSTDPFSGAVDAAMRVVVFSRSPNAHMLADRIAEAERALRDVGMRDVLHVAAHFLNALHGIVVKGPEAGDTLH